MQNELVSVVGRFDGLRALVIGDSMLDEFVDGVAGRVCREAPVPVVEVERRHRAPGGAANTAVNLAALGATVRLLSVVGDDEGGAALRQLLAEAGVSDDLLLAPPGRQTRVLRRVCASSHLLVRFDEGDGGPIDEDTERSVAERLRAAIDDADVVVVSDYDKGVLTPRVRGELAASQRRSRRLIVLDAKHVAAYRDVGVTAVKPNWGEAVRLLGDASLADVAERPRQVVAHGDRILDLTGAQIAAVTLDSDGAIVFERNRPPHRTYARPRPDTQATGAGDTFVAGFALALAAGASTPSAAEIASLAAQVVVGKDRTATCSLPELFASLTLDHKLAPNVEVLRARLDAAWRANRRVVFTNGCFDILHRGHITYLNRAKSLGDVLIVGVNGDESVRRLKGEGRPINPLDDRVSVLAALSCVDHIVTFDDDSPVELLRAVRPDVYAKGGDYTLESLPEASVAAELGCDIRILPFMEDRSTTSIIERIREAEAAAS